LARTADIALAVGLLLLYAAYGEADITSINEAARAGIVPAVAVFGSGMSGHRCSVTVGSAASSWLAGRCD